MTTSTRRKIAIGAMCLALLGAAVYVGVHHTSGKWEGVDETVVQKVAEKAGHPAKEPLINTDQGDLLLFVFLLAGAAGGFVLGYYFRDFFGAKPERRTNAPDA